MRACLGMGRLATTGAVVAFGLGSSLAGAAPAQAADAHPNALPSAMSARAVKLIVTPAANATLTQPVVRVQVRALAGAKTRIELGRANVTKRFGRADGRLVAHLRIRPGVNHLFVLAERRGRRAVAEARTFYLLRRNDRFVTVRVRRTRPYTAQVDVANPAARTAALRLAAVRRERSVRIWLNGRPVDRAASAPQRTRYSLEFSASHGLRFGVNRLTVRVVEPGAARYAVVKRSFVVPRDGPLAGAGWDRAARPHGRVLLRSSARAARGGKLSYRWTLVSRPRGSRVRLRGERSARPLLIPDRPGHYLVRQAVTERGVGAGSASVDQVAVTVSAQPALLALSTNAQAYDPRGIQIGSTFYPHNGPGATIQWLMLDRATLQPVKTGNSWCCDNAAHSLENLSSVLGCSGGNGSAGLDQLLIITIPAGRISLFPDQYQRFNAVLQAIGVNPLPTALLDQSQSLTIVGIPCAGAGSGWVLRRGGGSARMPQQGWLMPDGSLESTTGAPLYRFQPQRLAFNTRAASSANTNRMTFAGQSASVSITPGEGGFQVVEIDPRDLSIAANNAYAVTSFNPGPAVTAMAAELNAARQRGNYVAVQSIGSVHPDSYYWSGISNALIALGANPDLFNRINGGSYAFFGGPPLAASEVMQSASTVVVDSTTSPPTTEPGALSGYARQRPDGFYVPIAGTPAAPGQSLYDIIFKPSTPWPYTAAAGEPHAAAYRLALAYITSKLRDLRSWAPDLRQAYLGNPTLDYGDSKTDLAGVKYPGDGQTCSENPGQHPSNPGYTRTQFCNLVAELQREFDWIDSTRTLINAYETAMGRSGTQQGVDLRTTGEQIRKAVDPKRSGLLAPILYLLQSIAEVGAEFVGGPEIAPEIGLIATSYDLGSTAATNKTGAPVSQQISGRVKDLADNIATNVVNSANGLDGVRQVAISDYGRLKALAAVATAAKDVSITNLANNLTTGAEAYFATQLMPLGFYMWRLEPNSSNEDPQPDNCTIFGYVNPPFENIQNSAWQHIYFYRHWDGSWRNQSLILNDGYYRAGYPPPQTLTHTMFSARSQGGYGIEKSSWFWAFPNKVNEYSCD